MRQPTRNLPKARGAGRHRRIWWLLSGARWRGGKFSKARAYVPRLVIVEPSPSSRPGAWPFCRLSGVRQTRLNAAEMNILAWPEP